MSYSRPSFVEVEPGPSSRLENKYKLYSYREIYFQNPGQFHGVPALFIPGHAGSYKQARSIAAESTYYYHEHYAKNTHGGKCDIDFFTVHLNEEFSGLSGRLIEDQAEYLNDAIQRILELYDGPRSVILVGHSMGGIVARTMFMLPNYVPGSVNTVLTLATPHVLPPAMLDSRLDRLYKRLERYWRESYKSGHLQDVTLVSFAGGTLDQTVNSDAASLEGAIPSSNSMTVFSASIPHVWTSCDHRAILWCNQLVKIVAAALIDIIDYRVPSQTISASDRMNIFKERFLPSFSPQSKDLASVNVRNMEIQIESEPKIDLQLQSLTERRLVLMPIVKDDHKSFGVLTDQVLGNGNRLSLVRCQGELDHLSCMHAPYVIMALPASKSEQALSFVQVNPKDLKMFDYVGFAVNSERAVVGFIRAEFYNDTTAVVASSISEIALQGLTFNLHSSLSTTFSIPAINNPLLAYRLSVTRECNWSNPTYFPTMVRQLVSDHGESKFHVKLFKDMPISIHFHGLPFSSKDNLNLQFWMDPSS
ncbi:GPI inositol deacylase, partial [Apophysomyces ossiformis]